MKIPALQKKRVVVLRMAFRARKVLGTFEKRAPGRTTNLKCCYQDDREHKMADSVQVEEPQKRAVGGTVTTGRIHKGKIFTIADS